VDVLAQKQNKILIRLFIGSEAMFFLSLIIGYLYYTAYSPEWKNSENYLDIKKTIALSVTLLLSSVTISFSEKMKEEGNIKGEIALLVLTIILGTIFLTGQLMEYIRLFQKELYPETSIFGTAFYTLTGFHGLHVFIGIICLIILFSLS
jgi:cytochrome c oxidase subunit III